MSNIDLVTAFLREKAVKSGKDPSKATLEFLPTKDGKKYAFFEDHAYRMYKYIDGVYTIEKMEDPQSFYYSGIAFGEFAKELKDFDASQLVETIPNFHNTVSRYNDFEDAVKKNASGRAFYVTDEINFVRERKAFTSLFVDKLNDGSLPLRVTHNDTKLNNILFDKTTDEPICIVDLDTVIYKSPPGQLMKLHF